MIISEIKNVSIGYNEKPLVSEINSTIRAGELICLVGKNGAGKTTLIKTLIGALPPIVGEIIIHEENREKFNPIEMAKKISVVLSQQEFNPDITVIETLNLGRSPYKSVFLTINAKEKEKISHTINLLNIQNILDKKLGELSDGQKQRVMLARALVQDTDLIILDEPTAHLDLSGKFSIFHLLKRLCIITKKAIVIATHEIDLALQHANKVWFIKEGEFIEDTPEEIGWKHGLFDYFSNDDIRFDYNLGRFVENRIGIKQVTLHGSGTLIYWVKHALSKNAIDISEKSNIDIYVEDESIKIKTYGHTEYPEDISIMIRYLLSIKG